MRALPASEGDQVLKRTILPPQISSVRGEYTRGRRPPGVRQGGPYGEKRTTTGLKPSDQGLPLILMDPPLVERAKKGKRRGGEGGRERMHFARKPGRTGKRQAVGFS